MSRQYGRADSEDRTTLTPNLRAQRRSHEKLKSTRDILVSEGLLIALAPAIAYVYVYVHNASYFAALSVPIVFVSVDVPAVLSVCALFLLLFAVPLLLSISLPSTLTTRTRIKRRYPGYYAVLPRVWFTIALLLAFITSSPWLSTGPSGVAVLTMCAVYLPVGFLLSYLRYRRRIGKSKAQKGSLFRALRRGTGQISPWFLRPNRYDRRLSRLGRMRLMLLAAAILFLVMANATGGIDAAKSDWLVLGTKPARVVVSLSGDQVLAATFDRNIIGNNLAIYRIDKDFPNPMVLRVVGPLHPREHHSQLLTIQQNLRRILDSLKRSVQRRP